jgi:hypothetical protein
MAILYNLPRIGNNANKFAQKGPTCWYYAAKMILKFHGKYHKGDKVHAQFKVLHEVRKIMTELDADTIEEMKQGLTATSEKCEKKIAGLKALAAKEQLSEKQKQSVKDLLAAKPQQRKDRIAKALKLIEEEELETLDRLDLLTTFVAEAGFTKINKEQFAKPEDVEGLLLRWGPFYTGGSVVATTKVDTGQKVKTGKRPDAEDRIVSVTQFKPTGSHAIVVCGAKDDLVYYKDPQGTDEVRSMKLELFHKGLDTDAADFIIALHCTDGWDADEANCAHMRNHRFKLPA